MLDDCGLEPFVNLAAYLKSQLIGEMDDAFAANDRPRCISAIEQLYGVFDDEQAAY